MNHFLVRFSIAVGLTLCVCSTPSPVLAQQVDKSVPPAASRQQQPSTDLQPEPSAKPKSSFADDPQTQDSLAFTGNVAKEQGRLVLKDPITKMSYQFADGWKAKQFVGKQVKVIGKLDLSSNTIHIQSIEPLT